MNFLSFELISILC
uniref:Uncharacterized protein n=1 Tax=Pyronema omphalodes (strain CBS 100304) TaxID=1076935 RepID=U4LHZ0_PYROM